MSLGLLKQISCAAVVAGAWIVPAAGRAQAARGLSLDEALRMAEVQSEALRIARAGATRAQGQYLQARSQYLPQVAASIDYSRTLASQFEALRSGAAPVPPPGTPPPPPPDTTTYYTPCLRYLGAAGTPDAQRLQGLERYARCAGSQNGGIDFSKVGFGSSNSYSFGLATSVTLYSGGRVQAQNRAAQAGRRSADIEVSAQRALLALSVTEAYYDAVLADRLVAIAESSLAQTSGVLRQTTLARQVGNQSEFDLLRAQVTRDNQMPVLLQRRTDRDLAYVRLKQLLNLPFQDAVTLTTDIEDSAGRPRAVSTMVAGAGDPDTAVASRSTVRQLDESLRAQEAQVDVARAQWRPTITLSTQYAKLNFPRNGVPDFDNLLTNWTVTVGASLPLYTGGARRGGQLIAQAGAEEARARLEQTRELAALDARQTVAQLAQAEAALAASEGTAGQASRAYGIAEVRFREGLSTQIELSESRLLLEQSRVNRALAARNLQVARMRLALLKDLPLGAASGFAPVEAGGAGAGGAAPVPATGGGAATPRAAGGRPAATAATSTGTGQGQ
jgi:outer membrane protein TolC